MKLRVTNIWGVSKHSFKSSRSHYVYHIVSFPEIWSANPHAPVGMGVVGWTGPLSDPLVCELDEKLGRRASLTLFM